MPENTGNPKADDSSRFSSLFAHDLIGKPLHIFPDQALAGYFDCAHVPHPLHEIERDGNQSKDRDETHQYHVIGRTRPLDAGRKARRDAGAGADPATLALTLPAFLFKVGIGIPAGIVSAVKKDTAWDYGANIFALWGISTPNFWLGILMIFLFSVTLGWLPASGYVRLGEDWRSSLATTVMPAFVLGNAIAAILMRHTRSAMLQAMGADYVRTARAKGLYERRVVLKHALRNAMTPVITLGALEFGTLLSGAVLTEQIFTIPGFGKLIVDAVFNRDYAVVQGVVLVTATTYIVLNLLADIAYVLVNPRLRG